MNKLYVISVPIGNLDEITYLGKQKLFDCKTIFCEDTRVTRNLLNLLGIWNNQELIKLNQFNESEMVDMVCNYLESGPCSLVSDAGYPVISDPGYFLINNLRKKNIDIQVVNGPCAFIHAIVTSGIDSRRLFFANFLTKKPLKRKMELENFKSILKEATIVYYETKNFFMSGLDLIEEVYGNIKIGVARELSKVNETFYFDYVSELKNRVVVKGEFVIIIPRQNLIGESRDIDEILCQIHEKMKTTSCKLKTLCREFSNSLFSTKQVYSKYLEKYKR